MPTNRTVNWTFSSQFLQNKQGEIYQYFTEPNRVHDDYRDFSGALGVIESSSGYGKKNGSCYGMYQVGEKPLGDLTFSAPGVTRSMSTP